MECRYKSCSIKERTSKANYFKSYALCWAPNKSAHRPTRHPRTEWSNDGIVPWTQSSRNWSTRNNGIGVRSYFKWLRRTVRQFTRLQGWLQTSSYMGRKTAPMDLMLGRPKEDRRPTYNEYVESMADRMEEAYATVREQLGKAAQIQKKRYDLRVKPKRFDIGTFVWYYTPRKYVGKSPKWQKFYTRPYLVVSRVSPLNYVI